MKLSGVKGTWKVAGASLTGECEGVTFTGDRRWWGGDWTLVGEAPFPVPEKVILFVSAEGMEHGFWRDMAVGHRAFDRTHFVFCDTPALLPLIVGASTIAAIADTPRRQGPISVYVRGGVVRTKGRNDDNGDAIARHVAIHRALAADHRACIARWQQVLADAHGRGGSTWPPTGTIASRVGAMVAGLTWELPPESRDGAEWHGSVHSLRTELSTYGDRDKPRWVLAEAGDGERATHVLGGRRYRLAGAPGSDVIDRVARLVADADVVSIAFGAKLDVAVRGFATGTQLQAACRLVEQLLHAQAGSTAPYR